MNFNYEKAFFTQALPAFNQLTTKTREVHLKLILLVGDLRQGRDLNIPMTDPIKELIESLSTKEIAELSRASYFVGHWKPGNVESPFENKRGESWKIANCCDQILRKRLNTPHNIRIHEGKLRVTFSNKNCWLWEEFGLATEENLQVFKDCQLPFGESTLEKSAKKLASQIGDLWGDPDTELSNDAYLQFVKDKQEKKMKKLKDKASGLIAEAKQKADNLIKTAEIETEAYTYLIGNEYFDLDNVIYYAHTKRFCFGWRKPLEEKTKSLLSTILEEFPFDYDLK